eukprot:CAMPEP_0183827320 /NCGR_PEP_ID=MMETSP0807_2-20130328/2180_1 /TAXON_ID=88271 /ORGANISM="Picocystis salinarum, Strain CCMP1897" /LENGTH=77 /DNA_ID=CAMNT_0026072475 /DNA_START=445 /DNA_END=678 /DNA_ORIENTATION=+
MGRGILRECACSGCDRMEPWDGVGGLHFHVHMLFSRMRVEDDRELWVCSNEHKKELIKMMLRDMPCKIISVKLDEQS